MNQLNKSIAMALCAGAALVFLQPAAAAPQTLETAEIPAADLVSLVLDGGNGSARIVTGASDQVRAEVTLRPRQWKDEAPFRVIRNWFLSSPYEDIEDLLDAIRVAAEVRADGTLRLALTPAGSSREDRVDEQWTVIVPARLAVTLRMSSASMEISGVAGGVEVRAGHGSVEVDVPGGNLDIDLTVGDVTVKSGSASVGKVDLRSSVGSTRLWLNGLRFRIPNPPGPGSRVEASGQGDDFVRVKVEVGDISADINGNGGTG